MQLWQQNNWKRKQKQKNVLYAKQNWFENLTKIPIDV